VEARPLVAAAAAALALAAPARADDLDRLAPVLVHDSRERYPAAPVPRPGAGPGPVVYGRAAAGWRQYWVWFDANPQDRGIVRTGRHAGDWELVQYRGEEAVYAQHSGAERCADVERRDGRPVVYVANGSHAAYFHPGTRDRMWPDPNDEADGRGAVQRPRVVRISGDAPAWMRDRRPWGGARARSWVPFEQSSPPGPAFQSARWDDPEAWAGTAHPCTGRRCTTVGACDGDETALTAGLVALPLLGALVWWRRRRR
jgi:MYXO-CTERM domain-containing protein